MKIEQAEYHQDNPVDCDILAQNQQLSDCSLPSNANATDFEHHDTPHNTYSSSLNEQYKCSNNNNYKTYLCDYLYEGEIWSIEIKAKSFDDAAARVIAIRKGKIIGEKKASIPILITIQQINGAFNLFKIFKNYLKL
jgi:hypothetical protein